MRTLTAATWLGTNYNAMRDAQSIVLGREQRDSAEYHCKRIGSVNYHEVPLLVIRGLLL